MSVESKKADRKILAIFVAVIGFLATFSGYLYYSYVTTVNNKDAQISSLQSQIANLNSRVKDLENRVRELEDIVNLRVKIVLDKDKTMNIVANSYITLEYDTHYAAGYLKISFTATRDIYIWVANDYVGGHYYRYPVPERGYTYASSGSFIVPVLPGTTYIRIYNPSLFSGVTVTITIEYIY